MPGLGSAADICLGRTGSGGTGGPLGAGVGGCCDTTTRNTARRRAVGEKNMLRKGYSSVVNKDQLASRSSSAPCSTVLLGVSRSRAKRPQVWWACSPRASGRIGTLSNSWHLSAWQAWGAAPPRLARTRTRRTDASRGMSGLPQKSTVSRWRASCSAAQANTFTRRRSATRRDADTTRASKTFWQL